MTRTIRFTEADRQLLEDLVAVPSVTPFEGGDPAECARAQEILRRAAVDRGFREELHTTASFGRDAVPHEVALAAENPAFLAAQPSIVMAMGEGVGPDRTIVVNFHIDTVGPHRPPVWQGRRLWGRGSADDKGPGVAAMLGITAAFAERPELRSAVRVLLASVPGEEGGAMGVYGTRWLVEQGVVGRLMLFAEPTGLRSLDACSATMTVALRVQGEDSTDDHPTAGHNATLALGWLAAHLATEYAPVVQAHGGKLTIGGLHTGHHHNRVYGQGELRVNIAYYTADAAKALQARLTEVFASSGTRFAAEMAGIGVARRLVEDWDKVVEMRWLKAGIPPLSNEDTELRSVLRRADLPWADGIADGTAFTCDAVWAAAPGRYVVVCGPGALDANGAHTPDEWMDLDDLETYATRIRDLVVGFAAYAAEREEGHR